MSREPAVDHFYKTLALRNQEIIAKQYAEIQAWKREYKRLFWAATVIVVFEFWVMIVLMK